MRIVDRYKKLPKWFRFAAYLASYPFLMVLGMCALVIVGPIVFILGGLQELWEEFK